MDLAGVIAQIAQQFTDLETPFGRAKTGALLLTLALALVNGLFDRREPRPGLRPAAVVQVSMLTTLLMFNVMLPLFGAMGGAVQDGLGIDLSTPQVTSLVTGMAILMLILFLVASVALGIHSLLRGLGQRLARSERTADVEARVPGK